MNIKEISKEEFISTIDSLKLKVKIDEEFLYSMYLEIVEGLKEIDASILKFDQSLINSYEIIFYLIGEYTYITAGFENEHIKYFQNKDEVQRAFLSSIADKYLSLTLFESKENKVTNKYFPPISTITTYLNFMSNILNTYEKNDPKSTLITDLLVKSVSISRCIVTLLTEGYETEAFASWRTLHECEATLILLNKYQDILIDKYVRHMEYAEAFRRKEKTSESDQIFEEIKTKMKQLSLKSKDMKKFIEYGWLTYIPDIDPLKLKLNFRDGLQNLAGLSQYKSRYMLSSEILHSTPLLIYSDKKHYYYVTIISLYESFIRLENVFVSLFMKRFNKSAIDYYNTLRNAYYSQLIFIHQKEVNDFIEFQKNKKRG